MTGVRRRAALFYDGLPVSSGGAHTLRERDPRAAWAKLEAFLEACCQVEKRSTWLQLYERIDLPVRPKGLAGLLRRGRAPVPDSSAEPFRKAASAAFGHPNRIDAKISAATFRINQWEWRLEQSRMGDAMRILVENPVPDVEELPAALLCVKTRFLLKDPATGEVLPWQDPACYGNTPSPVSGVPLGESGWYVRLGPRTTCSLCLSLPFEEAGEEAVALAGRLQEHLPFKLSPHHWTRWQFNKAGTGYYARKVVVTGPRERLGPAEEKQAER